MSRAEHAERQAQRARHQAAHAERERRKRLADLQQRIKNSRMLRDQAVREHAAGLRSMLWAAQRELRTAEERAAAVRPARSRLPALTLRDGQSAAAAGAVEEARAVLALIEAEVEREAATCP